MIHGGDRVVVIGAVKSAEKMLFSLAECGANIVCVVSRQNGGAHSDYSDLSITASLLGITAYKCNDINARSTLDLLKKLAPDYVICLGWSQIFSPELLSIATIENIGYHPTALPRNRGRHPVIWSLALGLEETASTFFFLREGADTGPVISQVSVPIFYEDNASVLLDRLADKAAEQLAIIYSQIKSGAVIPMFTQGKNEGNYLRRRNWGDGRIDFRMHSRTLYNLIRALAKPYPGAHIENAGNNIKVWLAEEVQCDDQNIEPGKVIAVCKTHVTVKTADGAICLKKHEFNELPCVGTYL